MKQASRLITLVLVLLPALASATTLDVYANQTRTNAGGLNTGINVVAGQLLTISADPLDVWNIWAAQNIDQNGDGLPGICNAGGYGNCGEQWTAHGLTANVGALVGYIGGGNSFFVGTNFSQVINQSGTLYLHAFDGQFYDNSGFITVDINVGQGVPGPAPLGLLFLGAIAMIARRLRG